MTDLKEQFEMVLNKYFHKRPIVVPHDNGWNYKDNCTVAYCHDKDVVCYFELDEELIIDGHFNTNAQNSIRVTTPEDLEVEIQKFLKSEKELIKRHRLKMIEEL